MNPVWTVYDNATQHIDRVYESARDAQTCCDERNCHELWERWEIEQDDAALWADEAIRWAS